MSELLFWTLFKCLLIVCFSLVGGISFLHAKHPGHKG
jgi:hypothetical protein